MFILSMLIKGALYAIYFLVSLAVWTIWLVRGVICALFLLISLIFMAIWVLVVGSITKLIPIRSWRFQAERFLYKSPEMWTFLNRMVLSISIRNKIKVSGDAKLSKEKWYLLVSNHQTWLDILILSLVFSNKIPLLKFFMKKQLLWQLPLAGFACYLLGYPFMRRHTRAEVRKNPKLKGKDIETTKKACQMLKQHPATLINFVEGTRFTAAKHQRQESPYQHLLKPRAGGAAIVIEELHDCLAGILDVTISYDIEELSLWHLLCGRFKAINIHYELLPIPEDMIGDYYTDRRFRAQFQQWLNQIWEDKDRKITEFKNG